MSYFVFLVTLKNPDWFEKYFALASWALFSAACGLTISRPSTALKATLEAVPATWLFAVIDVRTED